MGGPGRAAQGPAPGRLPQGHVLPHPVARDARSRRARAQARPAAERGASQRIARGAQAHACARGTALGVQRSPSRRMACRTGRNPGRASALYRRWHGEREGSLRTLRRHREPTARGHEVTFDPAILWPALIAGLLVAATHVPLGIQVLNRGIVFIDLAVAQIAGLGVVFADWVGFEPQGAAVQVSALGAALAGALLLNWTEKLWPQVQEAIIGVTFVLAANAAILLLAANPHGAEHLKDLLIGQILWVDSGRLLLVAVVYALILGVWFGMRQRVGSIGFYVLFAFAVTASVQLVGVYLVFTTLIVPALATRAMVRGRLVACYALGVLGYAAGLALSLVSDLPPGPLIVCTMTALGLAIFLLKSRAPSTT